jgi:hypothetical protein
MFVRFRQTASRLQVSIAETRRDGGTVRQDHVAALGSIATPLSPADRIAFWTKLHQRLAGLSNRIDGKAHGEILAAVHARVPMPAQDEQSTEQVEHARHDARQWHMLADMHASTAAEKRQFAASLTREAEEHEAHAATATEHAKAADDRLARAERGEAVAGIPRPMTHAEYLRMVSRMGITERKLKLWVRLARELPDEATFQAFVAETVRLDRLGEDARYRAALRKVGRPDDT